jgi:hypothetical protein
MSETTSSSSRLSDAGVAHGNGEPSGVSVREQIERLIAEHPLLGNWQLEFVRSHWASSSDVLEYRRRDNPHAAQLMIKHRKPADGSRSEQEGGHT